MNVAEWRRRCGDNPAWANIPPRFRWMVIRRDGYPHAIGRAEHGDTAQQVAEIRLADLIKEHEKDLTQVAGWVVWAWPADRPSQRAETRVEVHADTWIAEVFGLGA